MAARKSGAPAKKARSAPKGKDTKRGSSAVEEQRVHTPQVAGSTPAPATKKRMSEQRRVFVQEYLKDKHATNAAIRAGYSAHTAKQIGSRLLQDPEIRAAVDAAEDAHLEKVAAETGISIQRVLTEVARLAFFDPRKLFKPDGSPLPINELDDDTAAALAGLEVLEEFEGKGEDRVFVGYTKKYKVSDKNSALEKLMKHLGAYKRDNEQNAPTNAIAALLGQLGRSALPVAQHADEGADG